MKGILLNLLTNSKKTALTIAAVLLTISTFAQSTLSGKVVDEKDKPVSGASVYLDNTIDGATTDKEGNFSFTTEEKGNQVLVATEVSHENGGLPLTITGNMQGLIVKMKTSRHELGSVTITAGSIEASGNGKTVLQPLDIVTTAGAQADIVKAIQTLPGTQQQGAQTGLFVRGGDAGETSVVVDGLTAQNAFLSTPPGVAARSRFGAFQYKGVAFSSGGYSARYGQALSSVLELNSNDMPDKSTINTGINMAGIYFSGSKVLKNNSIEGSAYYNNLTPFYKIANTNVDYYKVPQGGGGSAKYCWKPNKNGIVKALVNYTQFTSGTNVPNPDSGKADQLLNYGVTNSNVYSTVSYKQGFKEKWQLYTAAAYSNNKDDIKWDTSSIVNKDDRSQFRGELKYFATTRLSILAGGEVQHFSYNKTYALWKNNFEETQFAGYAEAEWSPIYWFTIKPGVRYEHSELLMQNNVAPRLAMGFKAGLYGQFSLAGGMFYQTPDPQYLLYGYRPNMQTAIHYIANYQYMHNERTLRVEAYYKDYQNLIREHVTSYDASSYRSPYAKIDNSGYGYATGAEFFYRDKKTVKNGDFWVSYSYIDTRRLYKNYLAEVQPDFIATQNLNIVTKYFIEKISTQVNVTYNYASGRPYYNPANTEFLGDRAPEFHNLSLTVNYLHSIKKWFTVIYAGVDNITNHHNVFGYRYDATGMPHEIKPALYRSVFVGVNFSLTAFDKDEL